MGLWWKPSWDGYKKDIVGFYLQSILQSRSFSLSTSVSSSLSLSFSSSTMAVPSVLPLLFGFLAFSVVVFVGSASSSKFTELFQPGWAFDHFLYEGELLKLKLDNYSGTIPSPKSSLLILFFFFSYMTNVSSGFHFLLMNQLFLHCFSICVTEVCVLMVIDDFRSWVFLQKQVHVWKGQYSDQARGGRLCWDCHCFLCK